MHMAKLFRASDIAWFKKKGNAGPNKYYHSLATTVDVTVFNYA